MNKEPLHNNFSFIAVTDIYLQWKSVFRKERRNLYSASKVREAFLISKGRTLLPFGLNIREEFY